MSITRRLSTAAGRLPVVTLLMVAVAVGIAVVPGAAESLQLDRAAVADGGLWQFVTCHWTHWSWSHLFWDVLALAVLAGACERSGGSQFLWCVATSALAIPLVLWFTEPWMQTYRGLSGIDSALFVLLAVYLIQDALQRDDRLALAGGALVLVGFAGKVSYEFIAGQTVFVDSAASGMVPVPMAHVIGGIVGLLCGIFPMVSVPLGERRDRRQHATVRFVDHAV